MTDPRIPESKKDEAALPDALDQTPASSQPPEGAEQHGSEDAQLIADSASAVSDPDEGGRTND